MAQLVKQGNIFGRIGSSLGKGLAEQIPKEAERNRLQSGLRELGQKKDLTPFQQFAELSAIPGATPQMIESGSKLLREQGRRNDYANLANRERQPASNKSQGNIKDIEFADMQKRGSQRPSNNEELVSPKDFGQPQILQENPLRSEAVPALPWTPERKIEEYADLQQKFPNATQPELDQMASENEARELSRPKAVQDRDNYFKQKQIDTEQSFTKHLEELLQKEGKSVYGDLTGETLNNLKRSMASELRTNPKSTIEDVANKWAQKGLQLGKTKNQLREFSNRDILDKIFKGRESFDKLKTYSKIFEETGNSEEFYNILKSKKDEKNEGFNMSPQGAAYIAYPRSKNVEEYVSKTKNKSLFPSKTTSAEKASNIQKLVSPDDSLLSIAQALKQEDPYFNEREYWDQLRQNQDKFNPRQQNEIAEGEGDVFADWGDLWILPQYRGPK